jgi:hypothetical protein
VNNTWFVVDLTWAAGYTDIPRRDFTKNFTDAWFFTNRKQFALTHWPDSEDEQFLDEPVSKLTFTSSPLIFEGAIIGEVFPTAGQKGIIKGREGECKSICFDVPHPARIKNIKVASHKGDLNPAEYHVFKNKLYVEVPFSAEGTYPVAIYVNDARGLTFKAIASKARKR